MDYALLLPNQVLIMGDLDIDFFIIGIIFGAYIIVSGISVIFLGYLTLLTVKRSTGYGIMTSSKPW